MNYINNLILNINFYDIKDSLLNSDFFDYIFPFLLVFSIFYTIFSKIKIFKSKKTKEPIKSVVFILSLISTFYGISFETSSGYGVSSLIMMLFPNISAITIGVLTLYIIGALFGKNFFKGIFRKDIDAFAYYAVGAVGLGAVIFYTGIAMGFWNYYSGDQLAYWNTILATGFLILGIVFAIIDSFPLSFVFLLVFFSYVFGDQSVSILEYFIDPFVFIFLIFGILISWITSGEDEKSELAKVLRDQEKTINEYKKMYNGNPNDYNSRIYDVSEFNFNKNKKKWNKKYGGSWK